MSALEVDTRAPSLDAPAHQAQRYCVVQERPVAIGRPKVSRDGLLVDPDGRPMRQLPITPAAHGTTHWASEDGIVRALYRADADDPPAWRWGAVLRPARSGLYSVGTPYAGGTQRHVRPTRAVALAWIELPPHLRPSTACAALVDAARGLHATNVGWFSRRHLYRAREPMRPGTPSDSESDDSDDEWRPVRYVVRQHTHPRRRFRAHRTGDMWINRAGQLRNAEGEPARSEPAPPHGEPIVLLPGVGAVPCADVVWQTFARSRRRREARARDGDPGWHALEVRAAVPPGLRPAEQAVYDAFVSGRSLQAIAHERRTVVGTVRVHLQRALSAVDPERVPEHVWARLLARCVRQPCARLAAAGGSAAFAGRLTEVRDAVEECMTDDEREDWAALAVDEQWAALRFAVAFAQWDANDWTRVV